MKKLLILVLAILASNYAAATSECPPGFTDTGSHCTKPLPYGRGLGRTSMSRCENKYGADNCEKCLSLYYPKCEEGYRPDGCNFCIAQCPANMTDLGLSCQK